MSKGKTYNSEFAYWWDTTALPKLRKFGNDVGSWTTKFLKSVGFDVDDFANSIGIKNKEAITDLDVQKIFDNAIARLSRASNLSSQIKDSIYALSSKVSNPNVRNQVIKHMQELSNANKDVEQRITQSEQQIQSMRQDALTEFDKLGRTAKKYKDTIVTEGMDLLSKAGANANQAVDDVQQALNEVEKRLNQ